MKKILYAIIIAVLSILFVISCSQSPTNPSGGGTIPKPTPNEFVEKLKTIGIVKAGSQEWNFASISQSQNTLTLQPTFNSKAGTLEGLKKYLDIKIKEVFSDFKYDVNIDSKNSNASDGNGDINKANSEPLELTITFNDKNTGNPVTDADFREGFILKIVANSKWEATPKITADEVKESLNKLGSIAITANSGNTLTADFRSLTVSENQSQYASQLTIDNKTDTIDLINFKETIEKEISKSVTSVLKIASISIDESTENSFIFNLEEVSANKILVGNLKLTVKFTGNAGFTERELNVNITGEANITTDNIGNDKSANFTLTTDADNLSFEITSITPKDSSIQINKNDITVSYREENKLGLIVLAGKKVSEIHNALQSSASFEITLTAKSAGYKDKANLKLILNIQKGNSYITLEDFNNCLNNINVNGFDKSVSSASLTLTASADVKADDALNNIKEALKALPKGNITASSIDYLKWTEYPTSDKSGVIMVYVNFAKGYPVSDELKGYLSQDTSYKFKITVKPKSKWIANISIDGDGANSDFPLDVDLGNGSTTPAEIPYKIQLPNGASINSITISKLNQAEGIVDEWNILNKNLNIFEDNLNSPSLKLIDSEIAHILQDIDIPKDSSQVYKVILSVEYNNNGTVISESIDLYVRLHKGYMVVTKDALIKVLVQGLSGGKQFVSSTTPVNININDNAVLNIAGGTFELPNSFKVFENATGAGSISYINKNINAATMGDELAKAGIIFNSSSLNFTKKQGDGKTATVNISISKRDGYIFDQYSLSGFNPSKGINIELYTPNQTWLD
ncbi:hypothetical protein R4K92_09265 [Brachyspira intermedia]|uniref:hypothetical protein n=1 Tax=Brachyspira intermedia TaxID=84377 RepID=UPI003005A5F0